MLIRVMYPNGKFDMVKPQILDRLLESAKVSGFMRSDGWANVGEDSLRVNKPANPYNGPERRNTLNS